LPFAFLLPYREQTGWTGNQILDEKASHKPAGPVVNTLDNRAPVTSSGNWLIGPGL
jgi:hypothetical protein